MNRKVLIYLLVSIFCLGITSEAFAKGSTFYFQFNGNSYSLSKGDKIQLGYGTKSDGSFAFIEKDEVIVQKENYSNNKGGSSNKSTNLYTGEKEYLGSFYANKSVSIKKVKYYKKMDQYELFVFTTDGIYTLHIEEAINSGELTAINGVSIGEVQTVTTISSTSTKNDSVTSKSSAGLQYVLYLKNGSEIKCNLLEMKVNDFVKVQTADNSVFVFDMDEVEELKEVAGASTNNSTISTSNTSVSGFALNNTKQSKEKGSIGSFYNTTELSYYIPNGKDKNSDFTSSSGGFGVRNLSGFQFKEFFFLGGGIGFNSFLSNTNENYHFVYFGLTQRLFAMGDKKISPLVVLNQNFGSIISAASFNEGGIGQYDFNFGIRMSLKKKNYLNLTVGYSMQRFEARLITQYSSQKRDAEAQYFSVNIGYSFKK